MFKVHKFKIERHGIPRAYRLFYEFNLKPIDLESYLDQYVIGQQEAKGIIATKICTHFHKIKNFLLKEGRDSSVGFVKNNILIIGPTGVGKTYMIKLIAQKIGVPFVKGDATKFSETGYVGGDIEDLIRDLYWEAGGDLEKARFGMIFLDEIDKIASPGDVIGPDVSRTGVQRALLKPLEETEVEIKLSPESQGLFEPQDMQARGRRKKLVLNTKYVLFVVSGAFQGLEEIIRKRLNKQSLGFLSDLKEKNNIKINYFKFVTPEDLVAYGFEREFVARFPVIAVFDPLTEKELFEILANPNNPIVINKRRDFKVYGIDLAFTDDALKEIAKMAYKENTGARSLARILEKILTPFERTLPSLELKYFGVTEEVVKEPVQVLNAMLLSPESEKWKENYLRAIKDEKKRMETFLYTKEKILLQKEEFEINSRRLELIFKLYKEEDIELSQALEDILYLWRQIKNYESAFERRKKIKIIFTEDAVDTILEEVIKNDLGVYSYCENAMSKLEYTLNVLKDNTGGVFYINEVAFKNPDKFVRQLLTS